MGLTSPASRKVVIAGGGFAAVEALLALRVLLGERAQITLLAANERLVFRSSLSSQAFSLRSAPIQSCSLREIAADAQARFRLGQPEAVDAEAHSVRLSSGAVVRYDSLVLALGARARVAIPGALIFRDHRDVPAMRALLHDLRRGRAARIVFAVPSGCAWPLPLYELAMLTATYAEERGVEVDVSLVSPAGAPLDIYGEEASALARRLLVERGVRFLGGAVPASVRPDGALQLHFGGLVPADRVVAAPQLRGPRIAGLPSRWWGFLPVDERGRVEGIADVYAAGDMTSFPIKQAALAAQQADVIASLIAAEEGVLVSLPPPAHPGRMMEARLLGGAEALSLRARAGAGSAVLKDQAGASVTPLRRRAPLRERAGGRYLNAYLAGRGRGARMVPRTAPGATVDDAQAGNGV